MRLAFLHGFLGDTSVWDGIAGIGDATIALPGHGGGPVRASWEANLDAITLPRCDAVVGYSLGARVALGLVAMGRAPRAILISVNPGIDDGERAARRASDAVWAHRLRTEPLATVLDAWEAQPLFATQANADAEVLALRRARRLKLEPTQLARSLEVMGLAEMPDYRSEIDDRFTLVVGADDAKYVALARSLPAHVEVIADSGHDPLLEQPTALATLLRDR